ncbi:MAG: DinB family protein [Thermomicrobiales bacterium]
MTEQHQDQQATGARIIRLLAIARGLEDEGQYNVAKLFRATAFGEGARATLDRPRPNSGLYEAIEAAIDDLRDLGTGAPVEAMTQALATLRADGFPTQADTPETNACRHCGQVMLGQPPEVCPTCRARRLTFQPFPPVWYNAPMTPDEVLEAMASNLADIQRISAGVSEAQADQGVWPFRAILAHLLGSEALLVSRAVRMLDEDEPLFVSVDPNEIGADDEGTPPTIAGMLEDLTQARQATIARFSGLDADAWQRAGTHPEFGRMTVTQQLAYLVRHEQWHLAELEERGT